MKMFYFLISCVFLVSCGIKGPPLPEINETAKPASGPVQNLKKEEPIPLEQKKPIKKIKKQIK